MALYSPGGLNLADTTAPLILAYDDTGTTDVIFAVSASGDLTITPDGGDVAIAAKLAVSSVGPHVFGSGSPNAAFQYQWTGAYTATGANGGAYRWSSDFTTPAGATNAYLHFVAGSITTGGGTDVYTDIATWVMNEPNITLGAGDTVTNATTLKISSVPTEGTNNRALWVVSGATLLGGSLVVGAPTGGDKGVGTINATAVYDDNVLLTDWAFDLHYDGSTERDVPEGGRLYTVSETGEVTALERRLPWMPTREAFEEERSLGRMVSRLWFGSEQQQIYIQEVASREERLEGCVRHLVDANPTLEGRAEALALLEAAA